MLYSIGLIYSTGFLFNIIAIIFLAVKEIYKYNKREGNNLFYIPKKEIKRTLTKDQLINGLICSFCSWAYWGIELRFDLITKK